MRSRKLGLPQREEFPREDGVRPVIEDGEGEMLSEIALEQVRSGRYAGPLTDATNYGASGNPGDGPSIEIWLVVNGNRVERAGYRTHGCPSSQAAAAMTCRLATGRSLEEIGLLSAPDLLLILGGLPEGKGHFADMAVQALQAAVIGQLI